MNTFYVAALTGQSGTGKSYASRYLAQNGIAIIDGDIVAREVVTPNSDCLLRLIEEFSVEILNPDGTLNRRHLAKICFSDPEKKILLDTITHPFIIKEIIKKFDVLQQEGHRFCVIEAAALIESGLYTSCDKIIMIKAEREQKISRIMERDSITREQAETRISAQLDEDLIEKLSHEVIENNGDRQQFNQQLDGLIVKLNKWFE